MGNITHVLENDVFQAGQFVQLYLQLNSIIQAIGRTVWEANFSCEACTVTIKTCPHWDIFHHQSLPEEV